MAETFSQLRLRNEIQDALRDGGFERMTDVQVAAIPILLQNRDVLASAKTGSGKTLAFVIPALQLLYEKSATNLDGTLVLIVCPTRELALQITSVVKAMAANTSFSFGAIIGGTNKRSETKRLLLGVNILVATPGRLLDHMQSTKGFKYSNIKYFVMDEADKILDIGFQEVMRAIIKLLPKDRQTALFSATLGDNVRTLSQESLKKPVQIEVVDSESATVEGLEQGYVICPPEDRFALLFKYLQKEKDKKVMVFFNTCTSVKFHEEMLKLMGESLPSVHSIHGKKKQAARVSVYDSFCNSKCGILLCTDVAARGLDIPKVDLIIQYDPPDDPKEYIHRVGRTARGTTNYGRALMFLLPTEVSFLQFLQSSKVSVNQFSYAPAKLARVQEIYERAVEKVHSLHLSAREAYKSYLLAYAAHSLKSAFDVSQLDLRHLCRSFGFRIPPKVDLQLQCKPKTLKRKGEHSAAESKKRKF